MPDDKQLIAARAIFGGVRRQPAQCRCTVVNKGRKGRVGINAVIGDGDDAAGFAQCLPCKGVIAAITVLPAAAINKQNRTATGGALLGDRIRVNTASDARLFLRSFATRSSGREIANATKDALALLKTRDFDLLIVETSGIGQGDTGILDVSDVSLYVMTCEFGAQTQLEKIDMLDFADLIAVNKFERRQAPDALRDVRTQLRRTRFKGERVEESSYPVYGTIASRFNDDGTNGLYKALCEKINKKLGEPRFTPAPTRKYSIESTHRGALIPGERINYLSDISRAVRGYHNSRAKFVEITRKAEGLERSAAHMRETGHADIAKALDGEAAKVWKLMPPDLRDTLDQWPEMLKNYNSPEFTYQVRGKDIRVQSSFTTLSQLSLPKVALPRLGSKAEIVDYLLKENVPGSFPYTGGVYPFRRTEEDPKRQFAGEGGPARTNKRFHYLSRNDTAKRLSTAFDSVTLYGAEPDRRPDIYGKIGESGVSIATLDDMKVLYSGFDLCSPATSVSMTINGPAPIILAMFLNTAVDQQIAEFTKKHNRAPAPDEHKSIYDKTLQTVRGTVQADILKEDQAQNTCIFSTEFALKLMGDIQEYFIEKAVRNYYSVSISGSQGLNWIPLVSAAPVVALMDNARSMSSVPPTARPPSMPPPIIKAPPTGQWSRPLDPLTLGVLPKSEYRTIRVESSFPAARSLSTITFSSLSVVSTIGCILVV